jgi:phospholipid/cholesterol/gamma-HCH transport system substrate-binding protein
VRRTQRRGPSFFTVGVIALIGAVAITYFGFTKSVPFRHHYEVKAMFRSANNVKPNSPVRIAGVNVGKVTKVELLHPGSPAAEVTMRLDKKALPLHEDAHFKIRPRIFLEGNFFVDVSPGTPSRPSVDDGHVFPVQQASAPVQLDQVLSVLHSSTRADLQKLLRELSSGLRDEGARGFNRSVPYWEPAYKNSAILSDATLGLAEHDLSEFIKSSGTVAQALDRYPTQLQSLVADLNTTGHAFAVQDAQLERAIADLPKTLQAAMPALASLNAAFPPTRRFARALTPATRSSGPALDASIPFAQQLRGLVQPSELRGLVNQLRPTVPSLAALNKATVPLYEQTSLASNCQTDVILPWSRDKIEDSAFPAPGPVYQESVKPLPGLAGESRSGDANGQWFRVLLTGGQYAYPTTPGNFLITGQPIQGMNPPPPDPTKRAPLRPDVPCETQQQPDLRTNAANPPPGFRIDTESPEAKAREVKAQEVAVKWLRERIQVQGLEDVLKVSDDALTTSEVPNLKGLGELGHFKVAAAKEGKK